MSALYKKLLLIPAFLLIAYSAVILIQYYILTDASSHSISDFPVFWRVAQQAAQGQVAALYDTGQWDKIIAAHHHDANGLVWPFLYPPHALFLMLPFGCLTYVHALALWSVIPLVAYYFLLFLLVKRSLLAEETQSSRYQAYVIMAAAVMPFLVSNLFSGQTGTFMAVLFLTAIYHWERPLIIGLCIGLMTIKPQMGILMPFALAASGQWRSMAVAVLVMAGMVVAVTLWLGMEIWSGYLHMTQWFAGFLKAGLEQFGLALAPYIALQSSGFPIVFAMVVQGMATLYIIAVIIRIFREKDDGRQDLRYGLLATGTLLAAPYTLCYDMPLLAAAVIPLFARGWRHGFDSWREAAALIAIVITPYAQPLLHLPVGVVALWCFFRVLYRRYRIEGAGEKPYLFR